MKSGNSVDPGGCEKRRTEVRRYQYSLRAMLMLTGIVAAFFSVARSLGYVDAAICLLVLVVLCLALRYPRPVRLPTGILLTSVAGILLWANLRATEWQREIGLATPSRLDPITEAMFWRGWPISPCTVCLIYFMKFQPDGVLQWALVFDGVLFVVALFATKVVCESCLRWRDRRMRAGGTVGSSSTVEGAAEQTSAEEEKGTGP